jgi:hypothetical protein
MLLEMEYFYPLPPNLEAYYLLHRFQIGLKVRMEPPMLGTHIIDKQFLAMWKLDNLEWRGYLAYNIICCYIQYHEPHEYGVLEFIARCLRISVLRYYCRLEIDYRSYLCVVVCCFLLAAVWFVCLPKDFDQKIVRGKSKN